MIKFQPTNLLFTALGGLVLLFIIAPLAGMFITTSAVDIIETSKEPEVQKSIFLILMLKTDL